MLSYSTLGSGEGPDVQKVADAVKIAKELRPNVKLDGPIQYDAAIDPAVAAVKVSSRSRGGRKEICLQAWRGRTHTQTHARTYTLSLSLSPPQVKGKSEVAGMATVFIFPDLNTGNNTYKAVQQATGAVAMGPIMQASQWLDLEGERLSRLQKGRGRGGGLFCAGFHRIRETRRRGRC